MTDITKLLQSVQETTLSGLVLFLQNYVCWIVFGKLVGTKRLHVKLRQQAKQPLILVSVIKMCKFKEQTGGVCGESELRDNMKLTGEGAL